MSMDNLGYQERCFDHSKYVFKNNYDLKSLLQCSRDSIMWVHITTMNDIYIYIIKEC